MSLLNTRNAIFLLLGVAVVLFVVALGSYLTNTGPWKIIIGSGVVIGIIAGIAGVGSFVLDDGSDSTDESSDEQSVDQTDSQGSGAVAVGGDNYGDITAGSKESNDGDPEELSELNKQLKRAKIEEKRAKAEYYRNASQREQKEIDAIKKFTETLPDRENERDTLDESLDEGRQ